MCVGVLSVYMSVHCVCLVPLRTEEGIRVPGIEMIVNLHVGAGC